MADWQQRYGQWALVLGAAEGIGAAFCRALAREGMHLIMVDVLADKVAKLATEIEREFAVETRVTVQDLSDRAAVASVMSPVTAVDCRLMVYNAAYGPVRPFLDNSADQLDYHLAVNCRTPLHLCHAFVSRIRGKAPGGIILMSSLAGLWGTQLVAAYGATKAFDWNLAEALHYELAPYDIDVLACCAGATATPNYLGTRPKYGRLRPSIADPSQVAAEALGALGYRSLHVVGRANRLTQWLLQRLLPRRLAAGLMNRTMGQMYS